MSFWQGKVALVTGAGSGIGRADCLLFAERGARVLACDIDEMAAQETARLIGRNARSLPTDVTRQDHAQRAVAEAVVFGGSLDVLINNAGILGRHARLEEVPLEAFRRVLDVLLTGTFIMCQAAVPAMRTRGGVIVNMSSIAVRGNPVAHAYASGKAGVLALTLGLARQLKTERIRVNALMPGIVETPMTQGVPLEAARNAGTTIFRVDEMARAVAYAAEHEELNGALLRYDLAPSGGKRFELLREGLWDSDAAWQPLSLD